jgi:PGF-pre-PGF domain-containing protein
MRVKLVLFIFLLIGLIQPVLAGDCACTDALAADCTQVANLDCTANDLDTNGNDWDMAGYDLEVGSLTIDTGDTFTAGPVLTLSGNFDNSGTFIHSDGTVQFNTTLDTNINLVGTVEPTFYNLINNNTGSSSDLFMYANVTVINQLDVQASSNGRAFLLSSTASLTMGNASQSGTMLSSGDGTNAFFLGSSGINKLQGYSDSYKVIIEDTVNLVSLNQYNDAYIKWVDIRQDYTTRGTDFDIYIEDNSTFQKFKIIAPDVVYIQEGAELQFADVDTAGFNFSTGSLYAGNNTQIIGNQSPVTNKWNLITTMADIQIYNASISDGDCMGSKYVMVDRDLGNNKGAWVFDQKGANQTRPSNVSNVYLPNDIYFEWIDVFNATNYNLVLYNSTAEVLNVWVNDTNYTYDVSEADNYNWEIYTNTTHGISNSSTNFTTTVNVEKTNISSNFNLERDYIFFEEHYDSLGNNTFLDTYGAATTTDNITIAATSGNLVIKSNTSDYEHKVLVTGFHMVPITSVEIKYDDSEMVSSGHVRLRHYESDELQNETRRAHNFYVDLYPDKVIIPLYIDSETGLRVDSVFEYREVGDIHTLRMDYNGITRNLTYYMDGFEITTVPIWNNYGNETDSERYPYVGIDSISIRPYADGTNFSVDYIKQFGTKNLITIGTDRVMALGFDSGFELDKDQSLYPSIFQYGMEVLDNVSAEATMFPTPEDTAQLDWDKLIANLTERGWEIDIHGESRYVIESLTDQEVYDELLLEKNAIIANTSTTPHMWTPLSGNFFRQHSIIAWQNLSLIQREMTMHTTADVTNQLDYWLNASFPNAMRNNAVFLHKINETWEQDTAGGVNVSWFNEFILQVNASGIDIKPYYWLYQHAQNQNEANISNVNFTDSSYKFDLATNGYPAWLDIWDQHNMSSNYSVVYAIDSNGIATTLEPDLPHAVSDSFQFTANASSYTIYNMTIETGDTVTVEVHNKSSTELIWSLISNSTTDTVTQYVPGFTPNTVVNLVVDNVVIESPTSSAEGIINFSYTDPSAVTFRAVEEVATDTPESTGSSDGDSAVTSIPKVVVKSATFSDIEEDSEMKMTISADQIYVKEIIAISAEDSDSVEIKIRNYESKPSKVLDNEKAVYQYIDISSNVEIKEAEIIFQVSTNWLTKQGYNRYDVILLHYDEDEDEWIELPTEYVSGNTYKAITPSFSVFAISLRENNIIEYEKEKPVVEKAPELKEEISEDTLILNQFKFLRYIFVLIIVSVILYYNKDKFHEHIKRRKRKGKKVSFSKYDSRRKLSEYGFKVKK